MVRTPIVIVTHCLDCGVALEVFDGVVCNSCMRKGLSMTDNTLAEENATKAQVEELKRAMRAYADLEKGCSAVMHHAQAARVANCVKALGTALIVAWENAQATED